MDTSNLNNLISVFRALAQKDSITPESLGYLLSLISGLLDEAVTSGALDATKTEVYDQISKIKDIVEQAESTANRAFAEANTSAALAKTANSKATEASIKAEGLESLLASLSESLGDISSLIHCDDSGVIGEEHIPSSAWEVLGFNGFIDDATEQEIEDAVYVELGSVKMYRSHFVCVPLLASSNKLYTRFGEMRFGSNADGTTSGTVITSSRYGTMTPEGVQPAANKIYINTAEQNRPYYWNGAALVPVFDSVTVQEISEQASDAYNRTRAGGTLPFSGIVKAGESADFSKFLFYEAADGVPAHFGPARLISSGFDINEYNNPTVGDLSGGNVNLQDAAGIRVNAIYRCKSHLYRYDEARGTLVRLIDETDLDDILARLTALEN